MDRTDYQILNLLQRDSRTTLKTIGDRVGLTAPAVSERIRRMEEKGAVHYEDGGRAKQYYPDIERTEAALQETEEFLDKVFGGRLGLMLNTMVEKKALSDAEITELYGILKKAEEEKR